MSEAVRTLAPRGVDVVVDLIGGVLDTSDALLADGGRVGSITDAEGALRRGGVYVFVRPSRSDLTEIAQLIDTGDVAVDIAGTYPFSGRGLLPSGGRPRPRQVGPRPLALTDRLELHGGGLGCVAGLVGRHDSICLIPLPGLALTVAENGEVQFLNLPSASRQVKVAPASDVNVTLALALALFVTVVLRRLRVLHCRRRRVSLVCSRSGGSAARRGVGSW